MPPYIAPPGKFLLVEGYLDGEDKPVEVPSIEEAVHMRSGLCASLDCVGAGDFASYTLYNDKGEQVPF